MSILVSKNELMRLYRARAKNNARFMLKLTRQNGVPLPLKLSITQQKAVSSGAKSIILSQAQMKTLSGGFLPLIPLLAPLLGKLFSGKGVSGGSLDVNGGLMSELFPLIRTLLTSGKGLSDEEIEGGFIGIVTKLLGSLLGKSLEGNEQVGGFISQLLKSVTGPTIEGMSDYFTSPRGKGVQHKPEYHHNHVENQHDNTDPKKKRTRKK